MSFRPLPPPLAKKAKEELFEDPEKNEEDVRILREWAQKQPHLKARLDDQFLLTFVRASKHSLERAKKKLDLFYTVRTALPEIFKGRRTDDPKIWEIINHGLYIFPPKPICEDGPRIVIVRPGRVDPHKYSLFQSFRPGTMAQDISLLDDDHAVTAGIIEILDCSGMTIAHFLQMDVVFMKKMAIMSGDGSFLRHKGSHFINTTPAFEKIFNIFKTFMNEKQKSRLFVHSSMESLFKHIPQHLMPEEYGGENGSVKQTLKSIEDSFSKHREWFEEDDKYVTMEALRPKDSKFNPEALFGVDGTFRKLEVD